MKYLILQRHGEYNGISTLMPEGEIQMDAAAFWIREKFPGRRVILSDTHPHIMASADILARKLETSAAECATLNPSGAKVDCPRILSLVDEHANSCDVLILVVSRPVITQFAIHFLGGRLAYTKELDLAQFDVPMGGMIALDIENRDWVAIYEEKTPK